MPRRFAPAALPALAAMVLVGCGSQAPTQPSDAPSAQRLPADASASARTADFDPDRFVPTIDNPLFPLVPGTRFVYVGSEDGEPLRDVVDVTHDRKTILGVRATVVLDRLYNSGDLVEKTFDYFAQDRHGNVWYLGENTKEFEDGRVVTTDGTWLAGVGGARPGIFMPAHPMAGQTVQQEFAAGVAEDQSTFVDVHTAVTLPSRTLRRCVETHDFTRLEPGAVEAKWYCRGVGLVRSRDLTGGTVRLQLAKIERF